MPTIISDHQVFTPRNLAEALQFMAQHRDEGWRPLAGGSEVMTHIYDNRAAATGWINLAPLRDQLAGIHEDGILEDGIQEGCIHEGGWVRIGALTTLTELRRSAVLQTICPLIRRAAAATGGVQRQNRATVGGRIVSASPAGETLPVWLALDAEVELSSRDATRCVAYRQFIQEPRQTAIASDELLTAIMIPIRARPNPRLLFRKVASRAAGAIGKMVFTAIAGLDAAGHYQDVRLAFGGMGPLPLRACGAEQLAEGHAPSDALGAQAANQLSAELTPVDDLRSTADYRLRTARNLTRAFVAGHIGIAGHIGEQPS